MQKNPKNAASKNEMSCKQVKTCSKLRHDLQNILNANSKIHKKYTKKKMLQTINKSKKLQTTQMQTKNTANKNKMQQPQRET